MDLCTDPVVGKDGGWTETKVRELFDEIGHAIASAEADHHYRGLDREADGIHFALAQVGKIRAQALGHTVETSRG